MSQRKERLRYFCSTILCGLGLLGLFLSSSYGADEPAQKALEKAAAEKAAAEKKSKFQEWDKVVDGATRMEGLFPLYYNEKEQQLFMEIQQNQYEKELILPMAIARGAGLMFCGGDTLNFGDQWLISFRRVGERILVTRHNVRTIATGGTPQADAVKTTYTDSIIKALPIKSEKSGGSSVLIDLSDLFMTDLSGIGISPDASRSSWSKVKAFPKNLEIEVSMVFSLSGENSMMSLFYGDDVPDMRGIQVVMHYGLSMLPATSYKTRLADDRVGHFLSMVKDFTKDINETPKVRYVTRWNLEKENPSADKSPPKEPIVFWIERSVPRPYRQYVREGILEWNKAFEKVGFIDAIQVRDQQSDDEFDPEDIRYNTFRWIATSAGFAMGPSRTNPKTGEILDADIIFDEGMVRYWRQEYLRIVGIPQGVSMLLDDKQQGFYKLYAADLPEFAAAAPLVNKILKNGRDSLTQHIHTTHQRPLHESWNSSYAKDNICQMGPGMQRQIGLLAAVLAGKGELDPGGKVPEKLIGQAIKEVVMHEVGHTLGLRHNFKASTVFQLKDINNTEVTSQKANTGSIMDYLPANIAPKGEKQGDYFSTTIGPYDYWAIEYAYKPVDKDEDLEKIATKAPTAELIYGTDEDVFMNPDPRINLFDLGDPLDYAKDRIKLVQSSLDELQDRVVAKGDGWQRARVAFAMLIGEMSQAAELCTNYIGGEYTCRDHRGDENSQPPMKPIDLAKQREALKILKEDILSPQAFQFKPQLLRMLAPEHWNDESYAYFFSTDYFYPILDRASMIQRMIVARLLNGQVLRSIQEISQHADAGQEVLQLPELFDTLTGTIWSELPEATAKADADQKIAITTLRRNLQREHVRRLSSMVLGPRNDILGLYALLFDDFSGSVPADARSLARQHLGQIDKRIGLALDEKPDAISKAHLEELHEQIDKTLKAQIEMGSL